MLNRKFDAHTGEWTPMAQLDPSTFQYLKPTDTQIEQMAALRSEFAEFAVVLDHLLPPGPDKTYIFRELRTIAMWANISITRHADGAPRESAITKEDQTG